METISIGTRYSDKSKESYFKMILAIITSCRRKDNLNRIIKALKNQTVKPDFIWVFYNGKETLAEEMECDNVVCSNNPDLALCRFSIGLSVDCEYVYYLDDDVFPEPRYIENCLKFSERKRCIIGSSGLVLSNLDEAHGQKYHGLRFWHDNPTYSDLKQENQVDFPLHSYFLRREDLIPFFQFPLNNEITERGSEIRLASRAWIRNKVNCYVISQEMGGYGETSLDQPMSKALFVEPLFNELRNKIIQKEFELGWRPIFMRQKFRIF